jgi:precorrin-2 dehydrogenase/sirohydrochlorin ferrochelatase
VVAPAARPETLRLLKAWKGARWERRRARAADLKGCRLAVLATGDAGADAALLAAARKRGVPVLHASAPSQGDLTLPASARAGRLRIAVSTSGASPRLAKALAGSMALALGRSGLDKLAEQLSRARQARRNMKEGKPNAA